MTRQDLRNRHPFHTPRSAFQLGLHTAYKRGFRHWLKARIARLRLALGI